MLKQFAKEKEGKQFILIQEPCYDRHKWGAHFKYLYVFSFLVEVDDTDWHHVDNGWIVDTLLDIYYSDSNTPQRPLIENSETDLAGPHYEDQWWIGARSYVSHTFSILVQMLLTRK